MNGSPADPPGPDGMPAPRLGFLYGSAPSNDNATSSLIFFSFSINQRASIQKKVDLSTSEKHTRMQPTLWFILSSSVPLRTSSSPCPLDARVRVRVRVTNDFYDEMMSKNPRGCDDLGSMFQNARVFATLPSLAHQRRAHYRRESVIYEVDYFACLGKTWSSLPTYP